MPSSRREFTGAVFAAVFHPAWCQGQNVIRTESSLVLVPVTVLDHSGHAVRGLTKDDFSLTVHGAATKIASFDAHVSERPEGGKRPSRESPQDDAAKPTVQPRVVTNVPADIGIQSTTVILLIDYLNTDLRDRLTMRETALRFFADRLTPGQSFAVYGLSYRLIPLLAPSADPAALVRAAKVKLGEINATDPPESGILPAGEGSGSGGTDAAREYLKLQFARQNFIRDQRDRSTRTLAAFRQLARAFAGVPGKKELLWLTGDASLLNPSLLYLILLDAPNLAANTGSGPELVLTLESLNNANVTVFPIDVRGVKNTGSASPSEELSHEEFNQTVRGTQPESVSIYAGSTDRREGEAANAALAMETFARETGGEVLRGSNDLESLLRRARETWDAYYVLSFVPPAGGEKQAAICRSKSRSSRNMSACCTGRASGSDLGRTSTSRPPLWMPWQHPSMPPKFPCGSRPGASRTEKYLSRSLPH